MDLEDVRKYCLSLPHVTERVQWGNDLLFCIGEKMFAVAGLDAKYPTKLSFKCTPEKFNELIEHEGIIPAPESAHAVRVAIDEALACKATGEKKVISFNLSGHGHFDMMAYEAYHHGKLQDYEYPTEKVEEAMAMLPKVAMKLTN